MKKYTLELTEKQARLLSYACDQFARLIDRRAGFIFPRPYGRSMGETLQEGNRKING